MSRIRMLNLFRCSSVGDKMKEKDIQYFVTDYFDGIKVEKPDPETTTLAECMGIKRSANRDHTGISHQRYCLYSESDQEEDIFEISESLPVLTVIQVFINPDIYQAKKFMEDGTEVSCRNCIKKIKECIRNHFGENGNIKWQIYRLLTAGDFAVIVRSKQIHDAYDISTLIRSVCIAADGLEKRETVFFTYSISGILNKNMNDQDTCDEIDWETYLDKEDKVIIRIVYSQSGNNENESNEQDVLSGYRLLGRYDYQIECNPSEFQELYTYIRDYKFCTERITEEALGKVSSENGKRLLQMIKEGHVLRINEKLLLHYAKDPLLTGEPKYIWNVYLENEWASLYEKNAEVLIKIKKIVTDWDMDTGKDFYPRERNLKEYIRLLGRLCRVLYEINQMRELRISTANLSKQLNIMIESLKDYIESAGESGKSDQTVVSVLAEYLRLGIGALEIFTRYIRNINLQTLQTPNYDLQTNMCIEKILLAYSQFLQPFLVKHGVGKGKEKAYYLSNTLYPIVVPNMNVRDLSVCVLFDDSHFEEKDDKGKPREKLMVMSSPSFLYLCETCFMLPTSFHEIAHQFRYESQKTRNKCLESYLVKGFIYNTILELLDEDGQYGFEMESRVENIVDAVYQEVEGKFVPDEIKKSGLLLFVSELEGGLQKFLNLIEEQGTPIWTIRQYIERTKRNVRAYNEEILQTIKGINGEIEKIEKASENEEVYDGNTLFQLFERYCEIQEKQLFEEILEIFIKIKDEGKNLKKCLVQRLDEFCVKKWEGEGMEDKGLAMFKLWEELKEDNTDFVTWESLISLLKHYHNLCTVYAEIDYKSGFELIIPHKYYQNIFENMCSTVYEELMNMLKEFDEERSRELKWNSMLLNGKRLEYLKKRIKFEKKEGIEKRLRDIFRQYRGERIKEFFNIRTECYREVTSDLFMCSMMGLDAIGYLVVVAENFVFNSSNEMALYNRISLVLQCLSNKRKGDRLDTKEFSGELLNVLGRELEILEEQCKDRFGESNIENLSKVELNSIDVYIKRVRAMKGLTTTQDWILRMLLQISYIIFNIKDTFVAREIIGDKEMWKDITSKKSYTERRNLLSELIKDKEGRKLLESIAEILNSPASYFNQKKYLLAEEIEFVLLYYEKNCKDIFR